MYSNVVSPRPMLSTTTSKRPSVVVVEEPPSPPLSPPVPSPRTMSELLQHRAQQLPNEPILGYPTQGTQYIEYTYTQLDNLSRKAAVLYSQHLPVRKHSSEPVRSIGLLAPSNLDYVVTTLALTRLGFTVLFLSTRISDVAYESLLKATGSNHLITHPSFWKTATSLKASTPDVQTLHILNQTQYEAASDDDYTDPSFDLNEESKHISWIIHSSGSTGLPKPIYQTHNAALRNYENNMNMKGFITLPLFHAHGLSSVFRSITSNKKIYMYNADLPLTRQNLLNIIHNYSFEIFYGVPYALKLLSETADGISALAEMKIVMFGGSACPDALGNLLVDGGVNLISHYGTTETGQLMTSFRPKGDKAWNYVRVHDKLAPFVRFDAKGGNMHELVVLQGWPSKVAINREDGSYATKDLFEPHPTIEGAWKYGGRLDDTIVLVNGEKAIPVSIEQGIRQHYLVREAIVFGSGRSHLGMIIIAAEAAIELPAESLLDAVWPIITAENQISPAYAQISREMIQVLPVDTRFASTDKGTIIRQAFYRDFANSIEEMYARLERQSSGSLVLEDAELRAFLKTKILELLPEEDIADNTDLFSLGLDSLQSTRLRASVLREIQLNGNLLPQNVVFEHPTIAKLADAIIKIRDSQAFEAKDVAEQMAELVEKYSVFSSHVAVNNASDKNFVVVTGATGSLGAHVAAQLALREDVSEVYCLVRATTEQSAKNRTVKSLRERAVYHSLPLEARRKFRYYPSDFSKTDLGLGEEVYNTIATSITTLIHCAWSVNFNKSLSSFEADCIAGVKNLITLCLSAKRPTPASFNFCSSVSTVANSKGAVLEALPESFESAQGMGYAQSKLVAEHIVSEAAVRTGMEARVLRVGQITGDTKQGIWNDTEAIPLMLQSATTFSALPALDESPRWLPVDVVAETVMDISLSSNKQTVFNIVNPRTFHWTKDLLPALRRSGLEFTEVDQKDWIARLRASDPDPVTNPTIKLIDFFASKYDNDIVNRKSADYHTSEAVALSPALAAVPSLTTELVKKIVHRFTTTSWATCTAVKAATKSSSSRHGAFLPHKRRLIIVSGPCGSGKSSVATHLAEKLQCAYVEGDSIHDAVAITKMSRGEALSSLDRQIWLSRIKVQILERIRAAQLLGGSGSGNQNIVLTCSALSYSTRQPLRDILGDNTIDTLFVTLQAQESELVKRVSGRKGHYMKVDMVEGQLATIEPPREGEIDVLPVDAEGGDPRDIADFVEEVLL